MVDASKSPNRRDGEDAPAGEAVEPRKPVCQPTVDIHDTPEGLVLLADLPGVTKETLELVIEDNILKIFGRSAVSLPGDAFAVHHEFRPADFYRSFILSDEVDAEAIKAELQDGVLTLRLPKKPTRPRRIELEAS